MSAVTEIDLTAPVGAEFDFQPAGPKPARKREPLHRRTFQHVRRRSILEGEERAVLWERQLAEKAKRVLEAQVLKTFVPGFRMGGGGSASRIVITLYGKMIDGAVSFRGKLYPSEEELARWCGCGLSSINAAKAWLKEHGWLDWDNRIEFTGIAQGRGQQVRQISNFYRVLFPRAAQALLDSWKAKKDAKRPEDAEHRRREHAAWVKRAETDAALEAQEATSPVIAAAAAKARREGQTYVGDDGSRRLC
jgi:hypothetical protein